MIMIIQIALGILLAIVILVALPLIIRAIGWTLVLLIVSGLLIAVVWVGSSLSRKDFALLVALSGFAVGPILARALERPLEVTFGARATPWLQVAIALSLVIAGVKAAPLIHLALSR
jgi:hypothetical protein